MKKYFKSKNTKNMITLIACIVSAFIQAFSIQVFMEPSNLLSGGLTGVALLLNSLTKNLPIRIDTSLAIILLNVPLAIMCYKSISPRFTFFSCINFALTSIFLKVLHFEPIFNDIILNISFGGFISAMSVVVALKGHASTGGTDFIALYFSNKFNKAVWEYIFLFNILIILIFGYTNGWVYAGYSIIFQFIATRTISTFHTRYERMTLQITTSLQEEVIDAYVDNFIHGITVLEGYGGYSKRKIALLTTVVSSYEVDDVIECVKSVDPNVIINILHTKDFVGKFYQKPID